MIFYFSILFYLEFLANLELSIYFCSKLNIDMKEQKALSLKTLTKSSVWDIQENDVFRLWESAQKDADLRDNQRKYMDVIKSAFDVEEVKIDKPEVVHKYEARGFKVGLLRMTDDSKTKWAIKKRAIMRVTDLTYENIHHISAAKLVEVLDRNFGGGWDSLSQSIQDIIQSGFDISTTTLPKDRLTKDGGMYQKKVADGFEVLQIPKGSWIEAIFAKEKPEAERIHTKFDTPDKKEEKSLLDDDDIADDSDEENDEDTPEVDDHYNEHEEDDDEFDDEKLTEESYRTTFDESPDDLNIEAEDVSEDEETF